MPIPAVLPVPYPPNANRNKQSIEVPGTKKPGQTAHYRSSAFPFVSLSSPDAFVNVVELFDSGRQRVDGKHPMLGWRPVVSQNPLKYADHYEWLSWDTVDMRRRQVGSALHKLFADGVVGGGPLRTVGIYSGNCPAWQVVDLATHAYEIVSVTLYDTLGKDTVEYIINHTEMSVIFVANHHVASVLKLSSKIPTLKMIIAMDQLPTESKTILTAWGEQVGIKVTDIVELEEIGKANLREPIYPSSDAVITICYTSGTTGNPKGVVMTHGNLANAVHAQMYGIDITELPVSIAFLPLAHCYGRMIELSIIGRGGSIGYWSGDPLRLLEDMQILKPNMMPAVPRILNRIYQAGMAAAELPGVKGALFRHALSVKLDRLHNTGVSTHAIWDRIVFKKVQAVLGGNVQLVSTGSAPMSPAAIDFLKVALASEVVEGKAIRVYGSTENIGTATRVWFNDVASAGTVGAPQVNTELKLVDVPAMGYTSEDKPHPRGEICIRGDHCFAQYYKDEANTKATIDEDGWQHSGDVGLIDESGRLKIIDRVKNIMKLSQGEYVALERVESLYSACPVVAQLYVHGDSLQSYLLGLVIPDPVQLAAIASRVWGTHVSDKDTVALDRAIQDPKVYGAILDALNKQARLVGLQGFETIKRIHLSNELLTVENGCMTPTLKLKRKDVYSKFKKELDALYALPEPSSKAVKL